MPNKMADIRTHKGTKNTNIILIAPHGYPDPDNDENTGKLTREIRKKLDCHAIVNEVYRKPKKLDDGTFEEPDKDNKILDLNSITQAEKHKNYLTKIKDFIKEPENTYVFWIHGIDDKNLASEKKKYDYGDTKCLVGYGQGNGNGHSMDEGKAKQLVKLLTENGISADETNEKSENYCGASANNMNQYFKITGGNLDGVQSVQLEFAFAGVRDNDDSIDVSSQAIAYAISELVGAKPIPEQEAVIDKELVEKTCSHVKGLIDGNNAMLKVGQYLIDAFYAGSYDLAQKRERYKNKSLIETFEKLNKEGYAPGKTWLYNSVKLAVDEKKFKEFRTYGKLGHSHKVYLTHVEDFETKKNLIDEVVEKNYTVKEMRARISELNGKQQNTGNPNPLPDIEKVKKLSPKKRSMEMKKVRKRKEDLEGMIKRLTDELTSRKKEQKACDEWLKQITEPTKQEQETPLDGMEKNVNHFQEQARQQAKAKQLEKQAQDENDSSENDDNAEETENNMAAVPA